MKLSTKAKYGLNACITLAERYESGMISISELSRETGTTEGYLEQIMALLRKANVVVTQRGAQGGYQLAKTPAETSVGELLRAVEDNLEIVECISGKCASNHVCKSRPVWVKLYQNINHYLDSISLQQLIDESKGA